VNPLTNPPRERRATARRRSVVNESARVALRRREPGDVFDNKDGDGAAAIREGRGENNSAADVRSSAAQQDIGCDELLLLCLRSLAACLCCLLVGWWLAGCSASVVPRHHQPLSSRQPQLRGQCLLVYCMLVVFEVSSRPVTFSV